MQKAPGADGAPEASSPRLDRASLHPDRSRQVDELQARPVSELLVHAAHGRVREVVLRPEHRHTGLARSGDRGTLQGGRDAAAAAVAADAGHPVLRLAGRGAADERVADDVVGRERVESSVAPNERAWPPTCSRRAVPIPRRRAGARTRTLTVAVVLRRSPYWRSTNAQPACSPSRSATTASRSGVVRSSSKDSR